VENLPVNWDPFRPNIKYITFQIILLSPISKRKNWFTFITFIDNGEINQSILPCTPSPGGEGPGGVRLIKNLIVISRKIHYLAEKLTDHSLK
jgi:hypothetical protein